MRLLRLIKNIVCGGEINRLNANLDLAMYNLATCDDKLNKCKSQNQIYKVTIDKLNSQIKELKLELSISNLGNAPKPPQIKDMVKLTYLDIRNILHGVGIEPTAVSEISDNVYYTCDVETLKRFLGFDKTNYKAYQSEIFDCDDFSLVLDGRVDMWQPALPFGISWSDVHAYNIFIDKDKNVWIVEPQQDKVMTLADAYNQKWNINGRERSPYTPIKFVMI